MGALPSFHLSDVLTPLLLSCSLARSLGDKRSSKSDQYSVLFETLADGSEKYTIEANMDSDLQLAYSFTRPKQAQGWKLGAGAEGGKSLFGTNTASPDGYVSAAAA